MRSLLVLGACVSLFWVSSGFSETVYKWRADDGSITYSTTKPEGDIDSEVVGSATQPKPQTSQHSPSPVPSLLRRGERIGEVAVMRAERRKQLKRRLMAERKTLKQMQMDASDEVRPGERMAKSGGGTRLAPAYFERLDRQKKEISKQEAHIKTLQKELRALDR